MTSDKSVIFIVGPHRSGTSAIAGEVARLTGANFGKFLMQAQYDNSQGFYENEHIVALNDDLLQYFQLNWEDPRLIEQVAFLDPRLDHLRKRGEEVIHQEFGAAPLIAIKDPRLCQTLPFWIDICNKLEFDTHVILTYRKIDDIVSSIMSRDLVTEEHGFLLTSSYVLSAERNSRDVSRTFVSYDKCIDDSPYLAAKIIKDLDIPNISTDTKSHVNKSHQHHKDNQLKEVDHSDERILKITKAINHLSVLTHLESPQLDVDCLDSAYHETSTIVNERGTIILRERVDYGKVLFIYESGTRPKSTFALDKNITELKLNWSQKECPKSIIIIPIHRPITLLDFEIEISPQKGFEIGHNSSWTQGNSIGFGDTQPRIKIDFTDHAYEAGSCRIKFGRSEYKPLDIGKSPSSFSLGLKALGLALSRPLRSLRLINTKNWKTLQSAIRRESPKRIARNLIRLIQRDKTTLDQYTRIISPVSQQENKAIYKKHILYVTNEIPAFDRSSGDRRSDLLLQLMSKDAEVICKARTAAEMSYVTRLENFGIDVIIDTSSAWKENIGKIDVVIYDMYYTFHDESHLRKYFSNARHIIDSVDVHWVREERSLSFNQDMSAKRAASNKERELAAYQEANEVWVVSEADKSAIVHEGIHAQNLVVISNIHENIVEGFTSARQKILFFLGNYNHLPNVWSALYIANELFPDISRQEPDAVLWIGGSNAPEEISLLGKIEGINFLGYIPENELPYKYAQACIVLAPVVSGAGVKGKILEAIAYGRPVVTNDLGNEGVDIKHGQNGFIANEGKELVKACLDIFKGKHDLKEIVNSAQKEILSRFSKDAALKQLRHSFYPLITICVVTHNRLDLLRSCVDSIFAHTIYPNFDILIYSNGCQDGTKEYLQQLEHDHSNVRSIYSASNDVFVKPNNMMMSSTEHDVVLLNNDTVVNQGWLTSLHTIAYRNKGIGITGAMLNNTDGTIQEVGAEIYDDGTGVNYHNGDDISALEKHEPHAVPYVSGCVMYIKRDLLQDIGLFDEAFHPCYFEDSDLCYRAWESDRSVIVAPQVSIIHHGGSTAGNSLDAGFKSYQKTNALLFLSKHGQHLKEIKRAVRKLNKELELV